MAVETTETIQITPEGRALADEIAGYVAKTDHVSHGELCNRLGDKCRGNLTYEIPGTGLVFFVGASRAFCDAVYVLQNEQPRRVALVPMHSMCHFIDGSPLPVNMPWAKRIPRGGYKTPHFASVGFRPVGALSAGDRVKYGIDGERSQ